MPPSGARFPRGERAAGDEPQEFIARLAVVAERAAQRAGDGLGVLLLYAAHHHAQVIRLDHDADARRLEDAAERIGNLIGEPLLDLEPPRKDLDDAGNLG